MLIITLPCTDKQQYTEEYCSNAERCRSFLFTDVHCLSHRSGCEDLLTNKYQPIPFLAHKGGIITEIQRKPVLWGIIKCIGIAYNVAVS